MRLALTLLAGALLAFTVLLSAFILSPPWRAVGQDGGVFFYNAITGEAYTCASAVMDGRCIIGPKRQTTAHAE